MDEGCSQVRFNAHLIDLFGPAIASCQGRIVKTTGDHQLVEFVGVVNSMQCDVEIQNGMLERKDDGPDDRTQGQRRQLRQDL